MNESSERRGRATIGDVASMAGVSVATVSRALRGLPYVSESTEQRVREAALSLNYVADPSARRLASGRTRNVEIAVPALNTWYFSQVLAGVEAVLSEAGYSLSISAVSTPDALTKFVSDALASHKADGLIMVDLPLGDSEAAALSGSDLGVITTGSQCGRFASVFVDNVAVGRKAVDHLFERGHRRIGFLAGEADEPLRFTVPRDRASGYVQQVAALGLEIDPALTCRGAFSVEGGKESMASLLGLSDRPTAVFASSDEMAFGALAVARGEGMSVPDDIAVIGVDGHDLSEVMDLTTIDQRVEEHGVMAALRLVEILEGSCADPQRFEIETSVVARGST